MNRDQTDLGPYYLEYRLPENINRGEQRTKVVTKADSWHCNSPLHIVSQLQSFFNMLHQHVTSRKFFMNFCCLLIFFKINFFEKFYQEYHQSNILDPVQVRHFVWPNKGPNCKGYQQVTLVGKELMMQAASQW